MFSRFSPAERGTALLAVQAEDFTRERIFQGVYRRRTLATTGERIALPCEVGGEPMGGEILTSGAVEVNAEVARPDRIAMMREVKNGKCLDAADLLADSVSFECVDPDGAYHFLKGCRRTASKPFPIRCGWIEGPCPLEVALRGALIPKECFASDPRRGGGPRSTGTGTRSRSPAPWRFPFEPSPS